MTTTHKLRLIASEFKLQWKLYARDRVAMFWSFAFPVLMLLGLGTVFRSGSGPQLTLVWVRDGSPSAVAARPARDIELGRALAELKLQVIELPAAAAERRWSKGETVVALEPEGAGLRLRLNSYLMGQAGLTAGLVNQAYLVAQARLRGEPEPARLPVVVESPGRARVANYAAFLLPGLIGLNLLSMGLFSVGMVMVAYREKGKFRRLAVTPLPKWIFLLGHVLQRLTLVALQSVTLILIGRFGFGIVNQGSYAALLVVIAVGSACFMSLGFALSTFAETSESYAAIGNLFFFPMMFLSGVYFSLDSAPRWMQAAVTVLPLSPFLRALRGVFNDGDPLPAVGLGLVVVAVWAMASFVFAVKRFRWA